MYLKEVKKEFKGSFKDVSSMFQENLKKKYQECVKNVSMKFCCAILLNGSHRSYPSRRRACFHEKLLLINSLGV